MPILAFSLLTIGKIALSIIGWVFAIIGILLLVVLLLIVIVLITPIRYNFFVEKKESLSYRVKIHIWLRIFMIKLIDGELCIKIFGIPLKKRKKKTKKKKNKKENEEPVPQQTIINQSDDLNIYEKEHVIEEAVIEEDTVKKNTADKETNEKVSLLDKIKGMIDTIKQKLIAIREKIIAILLKIKNYKEFLLREKTKAVIANVLKRLWRIVKHILPNKLKGDILYGGGDPYKTGQALCYLGILYGVYGKHIDIKADFEKKVLNFSLSGKGYIQLGRIVIIVLPLLWNTEFKETIKDFKEMSANDK